MLPKAHGRQCPLTPFEFAGFQFNQKQLEKKKEEHKAISFPAQLIQPISYSDTVFFAIPIQLIIKKTEILLNLCLHPAIPGYIQENPDPDFFPISKFCSRF